MCKVRLRSGTMITTKKKRGVYDFTTYLSHHCRSYPTQNSSSLSSKTWVHLHRGNIYRSGGSAMYLRSKNFLQLEGGEEHGAQSPLFSPVSIYPNAHGRGWMEGRLLSYESFSTTFKRLCVREGSTGAITQSLARICFTPRETHGTCGQCYLPTVVR